MVKKEYSMAVFHLSSYLLCMGLIPVKQPAIKSVCFGTLLEHIGLIFSAIVRDYKGFYLFLTFTRFFFILYKSLFTIPRRECFNE